jgi:hypothetical protein
LADEFIDVQKSQNGSYCKPCNCILFPVTLCPSLNTSIVAFSLQCAGFYSAAIPVESLVSTFSDYCRNPPTAEVLTLILFRTIGTSGDALLTIV